MAIPDVFQTVCAKNGWVLSSNQIEIRLEGGRSQVIALETFVHEDHHLARAFSVIGSGEDLSERRLRSALGLNFGLPHGALAIKEDHLVMTDTFVIDDADAGEVEASLLFLAETADRYEKLIYKTDEN